MKFTLHELAAVTRGTLSTIGFDGTLLTNVHDAGERVLSFSIDTRTIQPGQIFFALQGDRADGHDYLLQALQKGADGLIVKNVEYLQAHTFQDAVLSLMSGREAESLQQPFLLHVDDTLQALQSIASHCRQKHPLPLIGVTGSNGKTTVKDMTASILGCSHHILKSEKSFNNHIGLPLTLANMSEEHQVAVVEMGMNAAGELQHLARIARPDIGIITNIARAHFGFFHSLEEIMQAKMELIQSLPTDGIAVLNTNAELFDNMRQQVHCRLVTFGLADSHEKPTITAKHLVASQEAAYTFELETPLGSIVVTLPLPGRHNVQNALAAVALVYALSEWNQFQNLSTAPLSEVSLDIIKQGLEQFCASPMRMQVSKQHPVTIINDAYNANPASMAEALRTVQTMLCAGRKIAVLGDMFELGEISASAHTEIGQLAAAVPLDKLFILGTYAPDIAKGARIAGMKEKDVVIGESHEALAQELALYVNPGDLMLVKASRGMTMEKVLDHYEKLLQNTQ